MMLFLQISFLNTIFSQTKSWKKKIEDVNKKIPNTSGLFKKTDYNTKITEMENKIPGITGLVTTAALDANL